MADRIIKHFTQGCTILPGEEVLSRLSLRQNGGQRLGEFVGHATRHFAHGIDARGVGEARFHIAEFGAAFGKARASALLNEGRTDGGEEAGTEDDDRQTIER
ncbi:hypothetical protein [Devosia riboflavina]